MEFGGKPSINKTHFLWQMSQKLLTPPPLLLTKTRWPFFGQKWLFCEVKIFVLNNVITCQSFQSVFKKCLIKSHCLSPQQPILDQSGLQGISTWSHSMQTYIRTLRAASLQLKNHINVKLVKLMSAGQVLFWTYSIIRFDHFLYTMSDRVLFSSLFL